MDVPTRWTIKVCKSLMQFKLESKELYSSRPFYDSLLTMELEKSCWHFVYAAGSFFNKRRKTSFGNFYIWQLVFTSAVAFSTILSRDDCTTDLSLLFSSIFDCRDWGWCGGDNSDSGYSSFGRPTTYSEEENREWSECLWLRKISEEEYREWECGSSFH